jgi:hypothetical protein
MNVWGVVWGGTRTEGIEIAAGFLRDMMPAAIRSDLVVVGPEHRNHDHHSLDGVPELLVEDMSVALAALPIGVEVLGAPHTDQDGMWVHVRAPGGRIYGLSTGCSACRCPGSTCRAG